MFRANATEPYLTEIGPTDLHVSSITDFSPSPDGDLAIVLYDDSFCGLLDINICQKQIRQEEEAERKESRKKIEAEAEAGILGLVNSYVTLQIPKEQESIVGPSELQHFIGLFVPLPIRYHIGPIVAIATCPRKPLLVTCGQDRTLLVWNLAKRCVIASEKLTEPVNSCSFHPSGDLLAVGTSEKLLLYSLTFDQLILRTKWESLSCTCVCFSNGGHLLAAGSLIWSFTHRMFQVIERSA
jgi:WD40 repeat protein